MKFTGVRTRGALARRCEVSPLEWWAELPERGRRRVIEQASAALAQREGREGEAPVAQQVGLGSGQRRVGSADGEVDGQSVGQLVASGRWVTLRMAMGMLGLSEVSVRKLFADVARFAPEWEGSKRFFLLYPREFVVACAVRRQRNRRVHENG